MIERRWAALQQSAIALQQRVDASHPLDLYADFEPPDRPGLLLLTSERPPPTPTTKSISIQSRRRQDGRWSLRLILETPQLLPVFTELCNDIILSTRTGVPEKRAASAVIDRLARWRRLLEQATPDFTREMARGLLGELLVLHSVVLPEHGPAASVAAWVGPLRQPQDFLLPTGARLEVKSVSHTSETVRISALDQLDAGDDPITLTVVRLTATSPDADGAITIGRLGEILRGFMRGRTDTLAEFDRLLRVSGWTPEADDPPFAAHVLAVDLHPVDTGFPRLVPATVPDGVVDASYVIRLPKPSQSMRPQGWN